MTIPILSTSKRCKGLKIKSQTICTDSSGYVFTPLSAMSSFGLKKLLCSGFKELDTEKSRTSVLQLPVYNRFDPLENKAVRMKT